MVYCMITDELHLLRRLNTNVIVTNNFIELLVFVFYLVSFFVNLLWPTTRFPLLTIVVVFLARPVVPHGPLQANIVL